MWEWFWKMDRTREGTGYGINPLQPAQIAAWFRLRQIVPQPWHLDAIEKLDATRMRVYFEKKTDDGSSNEKHEFNTRPLSSELFDGLFPGKTN